MTCTLQFLLYLVVLLLLKLLLKLFDLLLEVLKLLGELVRHWVASSQRLLGAERRSPRPEEDKFRSSVCQGQEVRTKHLRLYSG